MKKIDRRQFLGLVGVGAASTALGGVVRVPKSTDTYAKVVKNENSLLGYWQFEGDLKDSKGNSAGQAVSGQTDFIGGPVGDQALRLNGTSFVSMGETSQLDTDQATIEFFFRLDAQPTKDYSPCLLAKRDASPETRYSIHISSDLSSLLVWNGWALSSITMPIDPFKVGEWYHFTLVFDKRNCFAYINGVEVELTASAPLNVEQKKRSLVIGASDLKGSELSTFSIAELAIYGGALSSKSITEHIVAAGWAEKSRQLADRIKKQNEAKAKKKETKTDKYLNDPRLFQVGSSRVYEGKHLDAIALSVGGIGTGAIQMNGKAEQVIWQIFNNFTQAVVPNSYLAVRVEKVTKALQTTKAGPFAAMKSLTFKGEYPFGWYEFKDSELPVKVSLETYNPMIPMNAKDSAIPCAFFNVTVENTSNHPLVAEIFASQLNAVGFEGIDPILDRKHRAFGKNQNAVLREGISTLIHMTADKPSDAPGSGDMALVVLEPEAKSFTNWKTLDDLSSPTGKSESVESNAGETVVGALSVSVNLKPKQRKTIKFVLTWHFPNVKNGGGNWTHSGNMYANWWKDAVDVARYVVSQYGRLERDTRLFHKAVYSSNMPRYLLDRMTGQMAILRSKTCFWGKDNYFGAWEGCNPNDGCCHGSCTHVWHYAQGHARLFPELGRIMRERTYSYQKPDGSLPHRHPDYDPATDGQLGDILGVYREHLCSSDGMWLTQMWPKVRKAMDATIKAWDPDENGVLAGAQWNTLDGALGGSTSWIGTLYLAALGACEKMALLHGDRSAAQRYRKIRADGARRQNETLWNGEYYMQIPDPQPRSDYDTGCAIDQVLGEWWGNMVGLDRDYPLDRTQTALKSLVKYNFQPDFNGIVQAPRRFVADDDPGMQMIKWPKGPRPVPTIAYGDEVMSGFEYSAAAAMVQSGLLREGYMVILAASDRYDGKLRTGMTYGWDTSGNPFGDDECGKYYARAMSVWSMLLASQGFIFDGPAGVIGFRPKWKPEDHRSFFTGAEGWGLFSQKRNDADQLCTILVEWGKLRVREICLEIPKNHQVTKIAVHAAGMRAQSSFQQDGNLVTVKLPGMIELGAHQTIKVNVGFKAIALG